MSVRITKCIGYALTDLKENDERIDLSKWKGKSIRGYRKFLAQKMEQSTDTSERSAISMEMDDKVFKSSQYSCDCVIHPDDLKNVLCIISPCALHEWYKHDDLIDYCYDYATAVGTKSYFLKLPNGIPPYNDSFMWAKTGKRLNKEIGRDYLNIRIAIHNFLQSANRSNTYFKYVNVKELLKPCEIEEFEKTLGIDLNELHTEIVPFVPDFVRWFCEYTEIFNGDSINDLRPIHLTYWS